MDIAPKTDSVLWYDAGVGEMTTQSTSSSFRTQKWSPCSDGSWLTAIRWFSFRGVDSFHCFRFWDRTEARAKYIKHHISGQKIFRNAEKFQRKLISQPDYEKRICHPDTMANATGKFSSNMPAWNSTYFCLLKIVFFIIRFHHSRFSLCSEYISVLSLIEHSGIDDGSKFLWFEYRFNFLTLPIWVAITSTTE